MVALLSTGCGAALSAPFTPPEHGGAPWVEITSPHFVVHSDLSESDASDAVADLERMYTTLADVAFPYAARPSGRTRVVLFRREAEYKIVAPRGSAGYFRRRAALEADSAEPLAVLYGDLTNDTRETLQHELTHGFISFYYPKAPLWLHEGLAEYCETLTVEDGHAILGRPSFLFRTGISWGKGMNLIPTADVPAVQDILEFDRTAFLMNPSKRERSQEEYDDWKRVWVNRSGAWALVHLLKNGPKTHRIRFDQYLTMLGEGKDDSRGAWLTLASAEEQNKLQSDFRAWLNRPGREITVLRTPYEPPAPAMEHARVMSPSDVHLVWSLVRDGHEMSEANAAIQLDPESSRARALRGRLHQKLAEDTEAETDFEAALSLSPDDVRYQVALFRFYAERATPRRAPPHFRQRADALVPKLLGRVRSVTAKDALARYLAITGRNEQALPLALEAVEADPSCWQCYDTLALLVAMQGDMAKAAEVQSLAVNLMPHGVTEESVIQRLRMYEGGAAGPAAGGPSTTGGDLSSDVVAKVLKLRRGAFRQCMSRSRNQTLDSKVVIRFVIDKDGSIFTASAEESTVQDDVIECLLDVVSSMRFPAPADGEQVTVRYPLSFKPPAQPAPAQPVAAP